MDILPAIEGMSVLQPCPMPSDEHWLALHGSAHFGLIALWLFAALSVALGEAQAGPSDAALPPAPQQPEEAAMTSSSGGGDMAGAASAAPSMLGSPYLGQNAPLVSHALQPALDVTSMQILQCCRCPQQRPIPLA